MDFETLSFEKAGSTAIVTFTTPDQLNSLTEARFAELEQALDALESDADVRAAIFTAQGKAFCVGLDLGLLQRAFDDMAYFESTARRLNAIILRIEALPFPTIAAVNGFARAGGFEMTLGCDFMIVAEEAKIGDAHTDSGVVPACVSLRLARRIGEQRAKELLWTARWLGGAEAVAYGLALRAVPLASLREEAIAFAATMTDKPGPALASLKTVLTKGRGTSVAEGAEIELASFVDYMTNQPYGREGYYAFVEKREPVWRRRD